jgi:hypothetical protein
MNLESDKRLNIQLRLDFSSAPTGEARQAGREDIESLSVVNESERPANTSLPIVLAQLLEPPCTDPYARWCGRGGAARLPPIPIAATLCVGTNRPLEVGQSLSALPHRVFQTSTCSAIAKASSTSMPRYLTVLSILVCPGARAYSQTASSGVRIEGQSSQVEVGLFVCSCAGAAGACGDRRHPDNNFTLW